MNAISWTTSTRFQLFLAYVSTWFSRRFQNGKKHLRAVSKTWNRLLLHSARWRLSRLKLQGSYAIVDHRRRLICQVQSYCTSYVQSVQYCMVATCMYLVHSCTEYVLGTNSVAYQVFYVLTYFRTYLLLTTVESYLWYVEYKKVYYCILRRSYWYW